MIYLMDNFHRNRRRNGGPSVCDIAYGLHQLCARSIFEQITERSRFDGLIHTVTFGETGQDQDLGIWQGFLDFWDRGQTVLFGHDHIEKNHIRFVFASQFHSPDSILGLANHIQVWLEREDRDNAFSHNTFIIHYEHTQFFHSIVLRLDGLGRADDCSLRTVMISFVPSLGFETIFSLAPICEARSRMFCKPRPPRSTFFISKPRPSSMTLSITFSRPCFRMTDTDLA